MESIFSKSTRVIALLIICTMIAGASFAATYYVDPAGNDGNAGTVGSPLATIQMGASMAMTNPGNDTVQVNAGTYAAGAWVSDDDNVTFLANGAVSVTGPEPSLGTANFMAMAGAGVITVDGVAGGFTLTGATYGAGMYDTAGTAKLTVNHGHITGNIGGIYCFIGGVLTVTNSTISTLALVDPSEHGIDAKVAGTTVNVTDTTFSNIARQGIIMRGGTLNALRATFDNCARYGIYGIGDGVVLNVTDTTMTNCGGPGLFIDHNVTATLNNMDVTTCGATYNLDHGVGSNVHIWSGNATVTMTGCDIVGNGIGLGMMLADVTSVTINGGSITNTASYGAIMTGGVGTFNVNGINIHDILGNAICMWSDGVNTWNILNSAFVNINPLGTEDRGAAVWAWGANKTVTVTDCLMNNVGGAPIWNSNGGGTVNVTNTTMTDCGGPVTPGVNATAVLNNVDITRCGTRFVLHHGMGQNVVAWAGNFNWTFIDVDILSNGVQQGFFIGNASGPGAGAATFSMTGGSIKNIAGHAGVMFGGMGACSFDNVDFGPSPGGQGIWNWNWPLASLTVTNCDFNGVPGSGLNINPGIPVVSVTNSRFVSCGGGVNATSEVANAITVTDSVFTNAGCIMATGGAGPFTTVIDGCTSTGGWTGLWWTRPGSLTIVDSAISGTAGQWDLLCGDVWDTHGAATTTVNITNTVFGPSQNGPIFGTRCNITLDTVTVQGETANNMQFNGGPGSRSTAMIDCTFKPGGTDVAGPMTFHGWGINDITIDRCWMQARNTGNNGMHYDGGLSMLMTNSVLVGGVHGFWHNATGGSRDDYYNNSFIATNPVDPAGLTSRVCIWPNGTGPVCKVKNNVFYGYWGNGEIHNDVNSGGAYPTEVANNFACPAGFASTQNPGFIWPSLSDQWPETNQLAQVNPRLRPTSQMIDAGALIAGTPNLDYDLNARVAGAAVDIGAFEFCPSVVSIVRDDVENTQARNLVFIVTFDWPVIGVDATDFAAGGVGAALYVANAAPVANKVYVGNDKREVFAVTEITPTTYEVVMTILGGTGTIGLDLVDDDSITCSGATLGGNGLGNGNATGETYNITDTTAPNLLTIDLADGTPTSRDVVRFLMTFDEVMNPTTIVPTSTGLAATLAKSQGATNGALITIAATMTVPTADGLINAGTSAGADYAGNALAANFMSANYTIDNLVPIVLSIERTTDGILVPGSPEKVFDMSSVQYTVTFDMSVTGYTITDNYNLTGTFKSAVPATAISNVGALSGGFATVITVDLQYPVPEDNAYGTLRLDIKATGLTVASTANPLDRKSVV